MSNIQLPKLIRLPGNYELYRMYFANRIKAKENLVEWKWSKTQSTDN